jgi:hypothetical protein
LVRTCEARDTTARDVARTLPGPWVRGVGSSLNLGGSMKVVTFAVAAVAIVATSGCFMRVAVISPEKGAYVTKNTLGLISNMYHCKADGGKPVCTQVEESE